MFSESSLRYFLFHLCYQLLEEYCTEEDLDPEDRMVVAAAIDWHIQILWDSMSETGFYTPKLNKTKKDGTHEYDDY